MLWRIPYICSSKLKVMIYNTLCLYTYYSNKATFVGSRFELSVHSTSLSVMQRNDMFNISYIYTMSYESLKLHIDAVLLFPLCLQYIIVLFIGNFLTSHILLMINTCIYIYTSYCGACVTVQGVHYWNSITNVHVVASSKISTTFVLMISQYIYVLKNGTKSKLYRYSLGIMLNDSQCLPFTH